MPAGSQLFRWSASAPNNPYRGILGLADGLVVTADSISMLVEAIGLGRPAAILTLPVGVTGRLDLARRDALAWLFATRDQGAGSIAPGPGADALPRTPGVSEPEFPRFPA